MGERDQSLDFARGLIIVLMALDHCRLFFTSATFDPVAVEQTNVAYFATRWVTHLCAPGFFFLAGLGASLAERDGLTPVKSTFWLVSRGLWLIAVELTVIGFSWSFNPGWSWLGVIASLGASMVCLGLLRWLPKLAIAAAALLVLAVHNAVAVDQLVGDHDAYVLLYGSGLAQTFLGPKVVLFPLIPWLAVMMLGYASAPWLTPDRQSSVPRFAILGVVGVAMFALLRAAGLGQPLDGGARIYAGLQQTAMSFLNVEKYPPSLQYVCITLGLFFLIVAFFAWLNRRQKTAIAGARPFITFGRVPFFFYVLHLFVVHGLALACAWALHWPTSYLFWRRFPNFTPPEGYGVELWGVYLAWVVVLVLLYPACAAYAAYKRRSDVWWLKYI